MNAKSISALVLFAAITAHAWNPGGHVWNGSAGDNNLDNAANWVTNKTNGGFTTAVNNRSGFAVDTPPGPNDVAVFPYGNYNFTLVHDYDWGVLYLGNYGTAANRGDFICDLNGHTLTVNNQSTVAGMESSNGAGTCATNFVFRNGRVIGFKAVNPGSKRTWSFIDCPSLVLSGTDWGADAGAIYVDNSTMTLAGTMRVGKNALLVVSNASDVTFSGSFYYHNTQGWPSNVEVRVEGAGSRFSGTDNYRFGGEDLRLRVLDGASLEVNGMMMCTRTGAGACTNCLVEVRNASFVEKGDSAGYRGHFGTASSSSGCRLVIDHPVIFSVPTALQMLGTSNTLYMAGPAAVLPKPGTVTFAGIDNKATLDDGAFVRTSNGSFNFSAAIRPSLTISGGARLEASTNIVNRPICYTNASNVAINVIDGGQAHIWTSPFSIDGTNTVVSVSNGTFHVTSCWASGSSTITTLGAGFGFMGTFDAMRLSSGGMSAAVHSPAIALAGANAKFLVTGRFFAGRTADDEGVGQHPAELRFTIPPEGWEEAPFRVEESIDPSSSARKSGEARIRDEVVFKVDATRFLAANRATHRGPRRQVIPLIRGVTNLTAQSKLKYTWSADVDALSKHAVLRPAHRLSLAEHTDAFGNAVGIDLVISQGDATIFTIR